MFGFGKNREQSSQPGSGQAPSNLENMNGLNGSTTIPTEPKFEDRTKPVGEPQPASNPTSTTDNRPGRNG